MKDYIAYYCLRIIQLVRLSFEWNLKISDCCSAQIMAQIAVIVSNEKL